jgi:hypothetical protein
MIVVARDMEGLRLVLAEMLEREHELFRLGPQLQDKSDEHRERVLRSVTKITLSPGYERWARHLMLLERIHKLGLPLGQLLAVEVEGMRTLDAARTAHRNKHPTCYACGMAQENRFQIECLDCGVKFRRSGR